MGSRDDPEEPPVIGDDMHRLFSGELRIATVVVDASGTITYFGPQAELLTGFTSAELLGRDLQVISGTAASFDSREYISRPEGNTPEFRRIRRADGETRVVQVYRHPIPRPTGLPDTLLLVVDVADSAHAEVGLGLLSAFFQQSTFGFVVLDTQLRYVALNDALARINKRPITEHLGHHVRDILNSVDMDAFESMLKAVLRTGEPVTNLQMPGHLINDPGTNYVFLMSFYRLTESTGRPVGLCGVVMDVSQQEPTKIDVARNRARLSLLNKIGAAQVTSLDFRAKAQELTEILVDEYCDVAVVDIVTDVLDDKPPPEHPTMDTLVSRIGDAAREPNDITDRLLRTDGPRPVSETDIFAQVLTSNRTRKVDNPDVDLANSLDPDREQDVRRLAIRSVIIAPLRARDTTLGALTFVRLGERSTFDEEDVLLATEIANRTALSIDNARLYGIEKQAVTTLQRNLIPQHPPKLPEVGVTFRYRPFSDLRAGGDWFDTISLPGRRVAVAVGDVAGHGINAAAAMGNYRTTVRTLASIGLEPAVLVTRLNQLSFDFGEYVTATCIFAMYDPVNHSCAIVSAGHPPPILATADGSSEVHQIWSGPLLGAIPEAEYRAFTLETPPGSGLLLYSDGVVESRYRSFDDGIDELTQHMQSQRSDDETCDRIMESTSGREDDRTVLLARFHGLRTPG